MENNKLQKTELNVEYMGYNYLVVKVTEDADNRISSTTHFFDDGDKAYRKFLKVMGKEEDMIRTKPNRLGYNTENIVEIEAITNKEIIDAYGTYDVVSGNIITQILILKNPESKAS